LNWFVTWTLPVDIYGKKERKKRKKERKKDETFVTE
jgi:hypothetical protein